MTTKMFGERVPRVEDARLVTGAGRFLDDLGHDALEVAFVRSPHAHARIVEIDVADALEVEGLVAIYTHEDLDGRTGETLPLLIPHPTLTHGRTQYALAKDEVNYVGEAIVMVVASSRYVAEDVADRVRVDYEFLPAVVGVEAARAAEHLVHEDVPGNVAAVMVQEVGDAEAAIDAAPHVLELDLSIERSASMPLEGKGVLARWDPDDRSLLVHTSTQTSTSVRQAIAAKLGLPVDRVEVVTPDVGGGFGVKIVHPWPEEVLVPWAARRLGQPVKWTEDRREHFTSSAHERGQLHHVRVGYDDDGRLRGLSVQFWHDNGAYIPYGLIVPIITSTQLLGPYKPGAYRVEFHSLYTNTVIVTPYRGAGRPQGCFVMERVMDAIAADLGIDRTVVRLRNFITPDEMPYDQGLVFQDGRPLVYDSGDFPGSLAKLKELVGWDDFETYREQARAEGRRVGIGLACYVEGTGVGPYEGGHIRVETDGSVVVSTGLTSQGQGHQTMLAQIVADELGVPFDTITVTTGDTRRFKYAVGTFASRTAVMSGSAVAMTARKVREKALAIAAEALEASVDDLEIVDGQIQVKGAGDSDLSRIDIGAAAVLSNPLRYAFDEAAATSDPVRGPGRPEPAAGRPRRGAGAGGHRLLLAATVDLRQRHARGRRRDRPGHRGDEDPALLRRARLRHADQPDDRRGTDPRRRRAGCGRRALRAHGVRRRRPAAQRVLHGLPDALRLRGPRHRDRPPGHPVAAEPARRQGRRRGRGHPRLRRDRRRHRGRRGDHHHPDADLAQRAVPPPRRPSAGRARRDHSCRIERGLPMKIIGNAQFAAGPDVVYAALNDPAVLVRCIPGCQRLEALGEDAYAMTVAAGVGSIKGVYDGKVRLTDQQHPGSFRMHAQGAGAAGTIGAEVQVTLDAVEGGGTSVTYDADATVGGMIGGVGQRMLVGVCKRMAAEFFGNVETALAGAASASGAGLPADGGGARTIRRFAPPAGPIHCRPAVVGPVRRPPRFRAVGAVFTAPKGNVVGAGGGSFTQGDRRGGRRCTRGCSRGWLDLEAGAWLTSTSTRPRVRWRLPLPRGRSRRAS